MAKGNPDNRKRATRRRFWRSSTFYLTAIITLVVVFLAICRFQATEFIEYKLFDLKFLFRGPVPAGPEVVIVAVDDASLKQVGRWPWSREVIAQLLERLKAAGPRVVALDIIFAEREETAAVASLRRLGRDLRQAGLKTPEIARLLAREEERADVDRRLTQAIAAPPATVLGFYFTGVGGRRLETTPQSFLGPAAIQASTYNLVRFLDQKPARLPLVGARGAEVNLPEITAAAAGGGFFNMIPDPDGTVRWLPLAVVFGPDIFAPLSLVSLQHFQGRPPLSLTLSEWGVEELRLGPLSLPVDRFSRLLVNYLGPPGAFPVYSAADVLAGRLPPEAFKDRLVMVGATAVGIYDLRVTPFSGVCPGVEIQATVMDNILRGSFLEQPLGGRLPVLGLLVALGLFLGVALPRLPATQSFLLAFYLSGGYLVGNYLLFRHWGWQVDLFYPLLEIALVYTGVTVQRFLAEEQERARLKKAFQSYVAPAVVEEIIRHPESLKLGGERRELSLLFCDIRGFTTLSETLEPEQLVAVLHDFLNPMSEIIVQHGGTLDKYMGDAIMALFGAPLRMEDHAPRACRAALAMVATLQRLDREWAGMGRPPLNIGIGINTGPVAVGNMGSDRLFDYTAVGDHVNLASRLEGLNKYYATNILVSEYTVDRLGEGFILQEVDLVRVKGKTHPLAIYEVQGESAPDPETARFLEGYREGLSLFRAGRFPDAQAALLAVRPLAPDNRHLLRHLTLAEEFMARPPGPEWDGVTVMESK